jgi:hypothetical protein
MTTYDRERLEDVMPLYINGRASAPDRAFVEGLLHDPEVATMAAWHQGMAGKIRRQVEAVSNDIGKAGLMAKINARRTATVAAEAPRRATPAAPSWKSWLSWGRWLSLQPAAFAALMVVVGAQAVFIHQSDSVVSPGGDLVTAQPNTPLTRGAQGAVAAPQTDVVVFQVNFKDQTTEREMRALLISTGAHIVHGPSQLGDYQVSVPAGRAKAALDELRNSSWVNAVRILENLSTKP